MIAGDVVPFRDHNGECGRAKIAGFEGARVILYTEMSRGFWTHRRVLPVEYLLVNRNAREAAARVLDKVPADVLESALR